MMHTNTYTQKSSLTTHIGLADYASMASALGTTVAPGGESGTVSSVNHMVDQLPDNPATLAASTSIETLQQILYQNWVWRNTFQVDSSMQPGHVFGVLKVHPRNCNPYITHISRMFLTWTGSFKIRTRAIATFQFGASLRCGFLPPKFTMEQVQNMPIQTLTAYPNVDLDPKNTNFLTFETSDERNVLFHWMSELDDQDPSSFGGYFVFYVAAPLVVSGGSPLSVSLLVEAAGDFNFAQLAPLTALTPASTGWVENGNSVNLMLQAGCDDKSTVQGLQINNISVKNLPNGFFMGNGLAGKLPSEISFGSNFGLVPRAVRANIVDGTYVLSTIFHGAISTTSGTSLFVCDPDGSVIPVQNGRKAGCVAAPAAGDIQSSTDHTYAPVPGSGNPFMILYRRTPNMPEGPAAFYLTGPGASEPVDINQYKIEEDTSNLINELPDESIVTFMNYTFGTMNFQTAQMAQDMSRVAAYDPNNSQLYQLFQGNSPTPVLTLRLHPSGMWTTRAVDVPAALTSTNIYLRYLQDLPMTSPLPPSNREYKFLRSAGKCSTRGYNDQQMQMHLWKNF